MAQDASGTDGAPVVKLLAKAVVAPPHEAAWHANLTEAGEETELTTPRPAWWWTGATPDDAPGYNADRHHITALPLSVCAASRIGKVVLE